MEIISTKQLMENLGEYAKSSTGASTAEFELAMACAGAGQRMEFGVGILIDDQQAPLFLSSDLLRELADHVDAYEQKTKTDLKTRGN